MILVFSLSRVRERVGVRVAILLLLTPTLANAADIHILTAGAYRSVLNDLAPAIEKATGDHVVLSNETTGVIVDKLKSGDTPDLVILPPAAAQSLGPLLGPATPVAKVGVGVAITAGAPRPDISTEAAIRALALASHAPTWIDPKAGGSSGIYMESLWQKWGISGPMNEKAVLAQGGLAAEKITQGKADLAFQQLSELMAVPGVTVLGPLPAGIQSYTVYAAAIPTAGKHHPEAAKILALLTTQEAAAALQKRGLETP
jgi:molybdate transport system substrate-binding protein